METLAKISLILSLLSASLAAIAQMTPTSNNMEGRIDLTKYPGPYVVDEACVHNMIGACAKLMLANGIDSKIIPIELPLVESLRSADKLALERGTCKGPSRGFEEAALESRPDGYFAMRSITPARLAGPEYVLKGKSIDGDGPCVRLGRTPGPYDFSLSYEQWRAQVVTPICGPLVRANAAALQCLKPLPPVELTTAIAEALTRLSVTKNSPAPAVGAPLVPASAPKQ